MQLFASVADFVLGSPLVDGRDPVDVVLQVFEWASGLLSTIALGVAGMLAARAGQERVRTDERFEKLETMITTGDSALWTTLRQADAASAAFRERVAETMVTKGDLREVEARLSRLIQAESRGRRGALSAPDE